MRIIFIGNFGVDFSSESHYLKTFRKLGHEVITFQENRSNVQDIRNAAINGDMLFWVHTHAWTIPGMKELLAELKSRGIPSVGYHLDLWRGIEREKDLLTDDYWNIEYFFTVDKLFVEDLEAKGIKAFYLPAGVYEDECYHAESNTKRFPHEVIFTGSRGYHHEWPYRPQLIDWLKETYGDRFGHYGGDGLGVVRGHDLNVLYASAKVVVGDTLCKGFNYPYYYSDRLFEVIGRGGFLIFPYIHGLHEQFNLNELVTYRYGNFEQLKATIDYFLDHDDERESFRSCGRKRVLRDHTYTERLKYILTTVNTINQLRIRDEKSTI